MSAIHVNDLILRNPWIGDDGTFRYSRMRGVNYIPFLEFLQAARKSSRYLEIGVRGGGSLAQQGRAVGIDPNYHTSLDQTPRNPGSYLYKVTSDYYFAHHNPYEDLHGPIDVAFVDGMHHFEYVVRDVLNVQRYSSTKSLIVLHDCIPWNFSMTRRLDMDSSGKYEKFSGYWTGDVWKAIPLLKELLPCIQINIVDCAPTGLVILSGLEPKYQIIPHRLEHLILWTQEKHSSEAALQAWLASQVLFDSKKLFCDADSIKSLLIE